jgi:CheY-like chemotaxis protein
MAVQQKILLLDDEQDFLDLYQEMLGQHLSMLPEVRTALNGSRALSMLEAEKYSLLILDLHMPKMDGLQVLAIARRKYPELRVVILTGVRDEQFRTRAYAMGVDQYWMKPETDQEMGLFMESIETLLSAETLGGFRGVQSKSLVDIIQLECLSQNSALLKITNGAVEGKIWIQNGEVVDAEAVGTTAEPAFQRILTWKTGSFEVLPPDPGRPRKIFTSYQGLLLNTAQALDEAASQVVQTPGGEDVAAATDAAVMLAEISQLRGVEFVLASILRKKKRTHEFWGIENPKPLSDWMEGTFDQFDELGEMLQAGQLQQVVGTGPQRKAALARSGDTRLCVGFGANLSADELRDTMKNILTKWVS